MQQVYQDMDATQSITMRLKPNVEKFGEHEKTFARFLGGGSDEGQNENPELLSGMDERRKWFAGPILPNSTWPHRKYIVMADRGDAPIVLQRLVASLGDRGVEVESWAFYMSRMMRVPENYLTLRRESGHTVVVDVAEVERTLASGDQSYNNLVIDLASKL